jgi:hypothetical protein
MIFWYYKISLYIILHNFTMLFTCNNCLNLMLWLFLHNFVISHFEQDIFIYKLIIYTISYIY